jgi:hypothetical protein
VEFGVALAETDVALQIQNGHISVPAFVYIQIVHDFPLFQLAVKFRWSG